MTKSKGADAPVQKEAEVSTEKFLNVGEEVTLRSGKKVVVKELSFAALVSLLTRAATSLAELSSQASSEDFLAQLASRPETQNIVNELFAQATGEEISTFEGLSGVDGFRMVAAVNKTTDFAEIFSVFQELGLQKILSAFMEPVTQTE